MSMTVSPQAGAYNPYNAYGQRAAISPAQAQTPDFATGSPYHPAQGIPQKPQQNEPEIQYRSETRDLDEDTFVRLAKDSGWDKQAQGALDETQQPERAANVLHPQPVVVAATTPEGDVVGAAGGTNYGEYAFLQYVMVEPQYHRNNVGPSLINEFQQRVNQENNGETSIATLSGDHANLNNASHAFYLQSGFRPLPNALVLGRGQQVR